MVKTLRTHGVSLDSALVALGWVAFGWSCLVSDLPYVLPLRAIARVLPRAPLSPGEHCDRQRSSDGRPSARMGWTHWPPLQGD